MDEDRSKILSIIRMVIAPISIISSMVMITMIVRSEKKLSTTQNRLLLGLAISDIIASIAMAFATLVMPVDTPNAWMAMGNMTTCEMQGFAFVFGSISTPCYNASLCILYLLKIRYNYDDQTIKRKFEPVLHLCPILSSAISSIVAFIKDYYNPVMGLCYINEYPMGCSKKEDVLCERGENATNGFTFLIIMLIMFVLVPITIIVSMGSLYASTRHQEKRMARHESRITREALQRQATYARTIMNRGLAYSGAWFFTFVFPATYFCVSYFGNGKPSFLLRILVGTFHPIQGFLNLLVFIYPKISRAQRLDRDLSILGAFMLALNPNHREVLTVEERLPRRRSHYRQRDAHDLHFTDTEIGDNDRNTSSRNRNDDECSLEFSSNGLHEILELQKDSN